MSIMKIKSSVMKFQKLTFLSGLAIIAGLIPCIRETPVQGWWQVALVGFTYLTVCLTVVRIVKDDDEDGLRTWVWVIGGIPHLWIFAGAWALIHSANNFDPA